MTEADSAEVLIDLERAGWKALSGGDVDGFYGEVLAEHAVMVLPVGVLDREESLAAMQKSQPWESYDLHDVETREVAAGVWVVTYRVTATRAGHDEYTALASSIYVDEDGEWRLALHQQSP